MPSLSNSNEGRVESAEDHQSPLVRSSFVNTALDTIFNRRQKAENPVNNLNQTILTDNVNSSDYDYELKENVSGISL